jgi:hypothetical protein
MESKVQHSIFVGIIFFVLSVIQFQFFMKPALAFVTSIDHINILFNIGFFGQQYVNLAHLQIITVFALIAIIVASLVLIKQKQVNKFILLIPLVPAVISAIYNLSISISIGQDLFTILLVPFFFLVTNFIYYLVLLIISIVVAILVNKTLNRD